jgi:hypothetical protein
VRTFIHRKSAVTFAEARSWQPCGSVTFVMLDRMYCGEGELELTVSNHYLQCWRTCVCGVHGDEQIKSICLCVRAGGGVWREMRAKLTDGQDNVPILSATYP